MSQNAEKISMGVSKFTLDMLRKPQWDFKTGSQNAEKVSMGFQN
jgi:hypothetical protein